MLFHGLGLACLVACMSVAGPALEHAESVIGPPQTVALPASESSPNHRDSLLAHIQGQSARRQGEHAAALEAWRNAVVADPDNAAAWRGIALSATELGLQQAAHSAWQRRLDLTPHDVSAQGVIGESLAQTGNWSAAVPLLLACHGHHQVHFDDDSTARGHQALLLMKGLDALGYTEAAVELAQDMHGVFPALAVEQLPSDRCDARWLYLLQHLVHVEQFDAAIDAAVARAQQGDALQSVTRDADRSRARASAARFHAAALATLAIADASPKRVRAYIDTHAIDGHLRLAPLIRFNMPIAEVLWRTGGIALMLGHDLLARSLFEQAVNIDSEDGRFQNALGWVLLQQDGPTDSAAMHLELAVAQLPDDGAALDSLGLLRLRQGRAAEALGLLQRARRTAVDAIHTKDHDDQWIESPEILLHLGDALAATGNRAEASTVWALAIRQLTGPIGTWQRTLQTVIQRNEWGLEVINGNDLYDLRFGALLGTLRLRLATE
jgi:tetratricopeptide (TPR) repeat protein